MAVHRVWDNVPNFEIYTVGRLQPPYWYASFRHVNGPRNAVEIVRAVPRRGQWSCKWSNGSAEVSLDGKVLGWRKTEPEIFSLIISVLGYDPRDLQAYPPYNPEDHRFSSEEEAHMAAVDYVLKHRHWHAYAQYDQKAA
jgi:hypothetical protein